MWNNRIDYFGMLLIRREVHHNIRCGQQKGYHENYRGAAKEVNLLSKLRIEIAVNEDHLQDTIDAITGAARSGKIGDGKIFVLDLGQCIRIRTGETGEDAIG